MRGLCGAQLLERSGHDSCGTGHGGLSHKDARPMEEFSLPAVREDTQKAAGGVLKEADRWESGTFFTGKLKTGRGRWPGTEHGSVQSW